MSESFHVGGYPTMSIFEHFGDIQRLFRAHCRPDTAHKLAVSVFKNGHADCVSVVNEKTGVTRDTVQCWECTGRYGGHCPACGRTKPSLEFLGNSE